VNDKTLGNRLTDNVDSGEDLGLFVELCLDLCEMPFCDVNSDENNLGIDAVLGLREQICCYEGWVSGMVRDNLLFQRLS